MNVGVKQRMMPSATSQPLSDEQLGMLYWWLLVTVVALKVRVESQPAARQFLKRIEAERSLLDSCWIGLWSLANAIQPFHVVKHMTFNIMALPPHFCKNCQMTAFAHISHQAWAITCSSFWGISKSLGTQLFIRHNNRFLLLPSSKRKIWIPGGGDILQKSQGCRKAR